MTSNIIDLSIIKSIYKLSTKFTNNKASDSQILEPLSTIIKLSIISFKNIGTKIAIVSNKIYIQSPNFIQGVLRWSYGNNREEVHFLLKPIVRAILLYNPNKNELIKTLFTFAISGLKLLKKSYHNNSSTLCHALDLYINIIKNALDSTSNSNMCPNIEYLKHNLNLSYNTKINLEKIFLGIWNDNEIRLIANMLNLAKSNRIEKKSYVKAIESILLTKEKLTENIIKNTTKIL